MSLNDDDNLNSYPNTYIESVETWLTFATSIEQAPYSSLIL